MESTKRRSGEGHISLKVDLPQRIALGATKAEDPGALEGFFAPGKRFSRSPGAERP